MLKRFIKTVFLSACFLSVFIGVSFGYTWQVYNGHYYALTTDATGYWTNAEAEAVGAGGHLVTINDSAEDTWLSTTFNKDNVYTSYWIGLYQDRLDPSYTEPDGGWKWISGETSSYRNWFLGYPEAPYYYTETEPNNASEYEDFAAKFFNFVKIIRLDLPSTDKWYDDIDGGAFDGHLGIIERTSPVPLPSGMLLLGPVLGWLICNHGRTKRGGRRD